MLSPDDECAVCGTIRENHGDKNHQFSVDGQLIPRASARPEPRQTPPKTMSEQAKELASATGTQLTLRIVELLTQKGLFNGQDLLYLFGGSDAPGGRNTETTTPAYRDPASAEGGRGGNPE